MRIVFVLPGSGISGGVRSTQRLASGLLERGHDVSVLYRQAPFRPRDVARNLYIRLRYRDTSEWLRSFRGRTQAYRQLTATAVGRNDVILAVGPVAARDVARIPDACGIKVENVHGTGQGPSLVLEAWRRRWPRIVVATHLQRAIEEAQCGPVAAVVPNGVDPSEYFPDCSSSDRTGVGTVWNAGRIKGPDTVLAALAQLRSSYPDLPFFMFSSQPRPRDLPSGVTFVRRPSVAVARRLYSRCRVWFCASRSEGFGLPLLEAMACGCAVVSSDCGGPGDIIRSGENGLLVTRLHNIN